MFTYTARIALALYLTVATAAGPWLCCSNVRASVPPRRPAGDGLRGDNPILPHCCGQQRDVPEKTASKPSHQREPCSCPSCPANQKAIKAQPGTLPQLEAACPALHLPALTVWTRHEWALKEIVDFRFSSCVDTLHRLHILRC
jgi:hypothetical protein